jgi:uncharacterized membrane protein
MAAQEDQELREKRLVRMEALSDGVFGVALTLLLVEIRPKGVEIASDAWWHQVSLNFGLFAASFFLVGIYWVAHKNESCYLTCTDRLSDWLNLVFLAAVALLPFSVSVLAESWHSSAHLVRAVRLYLGNVAAAGLALSLFFIYVGYVQDWLNDKGREKRSPTARRNASLPLLCLIAWGFFEFRQQLVTGHFLLFMAFPPAVYLGFTLLATLKARLAGWLKRTKKAPRS